MTKLTALLVGSGDSFLLESNNKTCLIDSGGNQKLILSLIPNRINLAICTHNDSDHCKGFLGILKSDNHSIEEIWLPGIWATVIDFVKRNYFTIEFSRQQLDNINLTEISLDSLLEESDDNIDEFTDDLAFLSDFSEWNYEYFHYQFWRHSLINNQVLFNINRICEIAKLAYEKGVAIKWFFPDINGDSIIDNFKPINSKHLLKMKKVKNSDLINFYKLAYITSENGHSLVFEYHIDDKPRILFTADSLIAIPTPYECETIITAPHHGSKSNDIVYSKVNGHNLVWIRSDRPSNIRPCSEFLKLSEKYCLSCTRQGKVSREKIQFEFKNNSWKYISGLKCNC